LGTNCDYDVQKWLSARDYKTEFFFSCDQPSLTHFDLVVLPGGFSYGDYLRSGALAAQSPIMRSVKSYTEQGGFVLGICNGFQILTEAGLLPGALVKNQQGHFVEKWVRLRVENSETYFFSASRNVQDKHDKLEERDIFIPTAHGEGRFVASEDELKRLEGEGQVWFRYAENFNGSMGAIAGVLSSNFRIAGLMPHPDRAFSPELGGTDGLKFL
jgi:phosphoribosylformylglycinamidine synthase